MKLPKWLAVSTLAVTMAIAPGSFLIPAEAVVALTISAFTFNSAGDLLVNGNPASPSNSSTTEGAKTMSGQSSGTPYYAISEGQSSYVYSDINPDTENVMRRWVALTNGARVEWSPAPAGTGEYSVYRDGIFEGTTLDNYWLDTTVQPGVDYQYVVTAEWPDTAPIPHPADPIVDTYPVDENELPHDDPETDMTGFSTSVIVTTPNPDGLNIVAGPEPSAAARTQNASPAAAPGVVTPLAATRFKGMDFTYRTFIPDKEVKGYLVTACRSTALGAYFAGDNRDFASPSNAASNRYRTRVSVTADWPLGGVANFSTSKAVTPTKMYTAAFNNPQFPAETQTASSAGISIQQVTRTPSKATFKITHAVGNPLCKNAPSSFSIKYTVTGTMTTNGSFTLKGERQPVPAHEAYARVKYTGNAYGPWKVILKAGNGGFACLSGACGNRSIVNSVCVISGRLIC